MTTGAARAVPGRDGDRPLRATPDDLDEDHAMAIDVGTERFAGTGGSLIREGLTLLASLVSPRFHLRLDRSVGRKRPRALLPEAYSQPAMRPVTSPKP